MKRAVGCLLVIAGCGAGEIVGGVGNGGGPDAGGGGGGPGGGGGTGGAGGSGGAVGHDAGPPDAAPAPGGCSAGGAPADLDLAAGNRTGLSLVVGGVTRHYALQVPSGYDPKRCSPLLVFLHGTHPGPTPVDVEKHYIAYASWKKTSDANGFLVALPVGTAPGGGSYVWSAADEPFIFALAEMLAAKAGVDPKRVYLAGFSSGAWEAAPLIGRQSGRFAAFGVHSGGYDPYQSMPRTAARKAGVYIFVGSTMDNTMSSRALRDELKSAGWVEGTNLVYREKAGWTHEYDDGTNAEQWAFYSKFSLP